MNDEEETAGSLEGGEEEAKDEEDEVREVDNNDALEESEEPGVNDHDKTVNLYSID